MAWEEQEQFGRQALSKQKHVCTDTSGVHLAAAAWRWRPLEHLQAAMYLYVPHGYCTDARALCLRQHIRISDFRHYWFEGG
jgi:hypothetical protein